MDEILNLTESVSEGFPSYFSDFSITLPANLGKRQKLCNCEFESYDMKNEALEDAKPLRLPKFIL